MRATTICVAVAACFAAVGGVAASGQTETMLFMELSDAEDPYGLIYSVVRKEQ